MLASTGEAEGGARALMVREEKTLATNKKAYHDYFVDETFRPASRSPAPR